MFSKKISLALVFVLLFPTLKAQVVSYDDVAVIYNVNSIASQEIATYFQGARNIPAVNMIPVDVPELEHITMDVFDDLRQQVEEYLIANQLVDEINYLVNTKGVPFRIGTSLCNTPGTFSQCSSVESELTLILGPYADQIGATSTFDNPYLNSVTAHSRSEYGIYLVTRLDGYKVDDVIDLIDRSGPNRPVIKEDAIFIADVADQPYAQTNIWQNYFNQHMTTLIADGWNTLIDTDSNVVITEMDNVLGYIGLHQQPVLGVPEFQWIPGGLAMEWMGLSAYSFSYNEPEPGHRRLADRIAEGASGARGEVGVTFASYLSLAHPTFARYTDTTLHFNLAESYYVGVGRLSSTDLVIGDPKTSIILDSPTSVTDLGLRGDAHAFPNPSSAIFNVSVPERMVGSYSVFDISGRTIQTRTISPASSVILDLGNEADGTYFVELITTEGLRSMVKVQVRNQE